MSRVIQMIPTSNDNSFFLIGFDGDKIKFRVNHNASHLQEESFELKGNMIYVSFYNFDVNYLNKFIQENNLFQNKENINLKSII